MISIILWIRGTVSEPWSEHCLAERVNDGGMEFYLKNPTGIGSRPSGLIGLCVRAKGRARGKRKTQPAERSSWRGGEGQQGLHCGEANPNQRLGGTSGQRPNAGSLC